MSFHSNILFPYYTCDDSHTDLADPVLYNIYRGCHNTRLLVVNKQTKNIIIIIILLPPPPNFTVSTSQRKVTVGLLICQDLTNWDRRTQ